MAGALIKWPIAQSGAGPDLDAYLQARNINRTATLAFMGADLDQFKKGYTDSAGVTHKLKDTADSAVSEAVLIHLWLEARRQWQARNTAIDPATVAKPAVATPGALSVATASGGGSSSHKPPKDFPQWADQIELYNKRLLGGRAPRVPGTPGRRGGACQALA